MFVISNSQLEKLPVFKTIGTAIGVGLLAAFFEGPFLANTNNVQRFKLKNEIEREPYERYRALGEKAQQLNSHHLANLEKQGLQTLDEARS